MEVPPESQSKHLLWIKSAREARTWIGKLFLYLIKLLHHNSKIVRTWLTSFDSSPLIKSSFNKLRFVHSNRQLWLSVKRIQFLEMAASNFRVSWDKTYKLSTHVCWFQFSNTTFGLYWTKNLFIIELKFIPEIIFLISLVLSGFDFCFDFVETE